MPSPLPNPPPPPTIPYSTGRTLRTESHGSGQAVIAAGCFLFLIGCLYFAFWQFYSDQMGVFFWCDRLFVLMRWDQQNAGSNTVGFFQTVPPNIISTLSVYRGAPIGEGVSFPINQLPFAAGFGVFLAAALFDWRTVHVRWLAAAVPAMAGIWRFVELSATVITTATKPAAPGGFGAGGWAMPAVNNPTTMTTTGVGILAVSVFLQALCCYFAAWLGRPIAGWLAGLILPVNFAESLQAMWQR